MVTIRMHGSICANITRQIMFISCIFPTISSLIHFIHENMLLLHFAQRVSFYASFFSFFFFFLLFAFIYFKSLPVDIFFVQFIKSFISLWAVVLHRTLCECKIVFEIFSFKFCLSCDIKWWIYQSIIHSVSSARLRRQAGD